MASNQTANYGLNQWEATDKVMREDFNADNAKIDAALHGMAETHNADMATLREERLWVKILDQTLTAASTSVTLNIPDAANYEMLEVHYSMVGAETLKLKINDGIALWKNAEDTTVKSITIFTNQFSADHPLVLAAGHIRVCQGSNVTGLFGEYTGIMCRKSYYCESSGGDVFASTTVNLSAVTKIVLTSTGSMKVGSRFAIYGLKK